METIAWIGFSQGLFAAILLLAKKELGVSGKILTAWLLLLALEFLTCAIDYRTYGIPLLSSSFLLFNPAFYLYTRTLVGGQFKLDSIQLIHLLPFLLFESLAYAYKEPYSLQLFLDPGNTRWFRFAFAIASVVSWIGYNWATGMVLFKHRKRILDEFSTIESNKRVTWLIFIVVFYNLYCLAGMAVAIAVIILKLQIPLSPIYNYSALLGMVYILGFYGIRQGMVFTGPIPEEEKEKYRNSSLTEDRKEEINVLLNDYFIKKRPFLNPDLDMRLLSDALDVPKHQLTEVLSTVMKKNFFQYVNEYRVEAVKKMLVKKRDYSIEAIGYECGFNSKSSFFKVFKQITGMTPLNWYKLH